MSYSPSEFSTTSPTQRIMAEVAEHWKRGDYREAAQLLQRSSRQQPENEQFLAKLGLTYAMTYDFAAADQQFEILLAKSKDRTAALLMVAHEWLKVRQYERARKYFEELAAGKNAPILACLRLAEFYDRQRNLPLAVEFAERALHFKPQDGPSLLIRAKLHRAQKQLEDAERLLRAILANPENRAIHPGTFDELGNVLDAQGRYDEAMAALVEGKALCAAESVKHLAQLKTKQAARKQLSEKLSRTLIERWRHQGKTELQPQHNLALLCGHARSGTTMLEYVLDCHPSVASADETFVFSNTAYSTVLEAQKGKTPFVNALDALSLRTIRQIRTNYFKGIESYLGQPLGERLLIDKNPVLTPEIPEFTRMFPEAKLLVALRDPRDVCLSCFMQSARLNADSSSWLSIEGTINNYASIMGLWLQVKPMFADFAIEVRYEDMVQDLGTNAQRVLEFLGLPWNDRVLKFNEHAQKKIVRSPTFSEVTKPVYKSSVGRWKNYEKYFASHLDRLEPFLTAFGYTD